MLAPLVPECDTLPAIRDTPGTIPLLLSGQVRIQLDERGLHPSPSFRAHEHGWDVCLVSYGLRAAVTEVIEDNRCRHAELTP